MKASFARYSVQIGQVTGSPELAVGELTRFLRYLIQSEQYAGNRFKHQFYYFRVTMCSDAKFNGHERFWIQIERGKRNRSKT